MNAIKGQNNVTRKFLLNKLVELLANKNTIG